MGDPEKEIDVLKGITSLVLNMRCLFDLQVKMLGRWSAIESGVQVRVADINLGVLFICFSLFFFFIEAYIKP